MRAALLRSALRGAALAAVVALATLGAAAQPVTHTVTIDATNYAPKFLQVHPGETIVWENKDLVAHTVTAKSGAFDSKQIAPGKSWSFTPTAKGQFDYHCTLHPTMKGTLLVG